MLTSMLDVTYAEFPQLLKMACMGTETLPYSCITMLWGKLWRLYNRGGMTERGSADDFTKAIQGD